MEGTIYLIHFEHPYMGRPSRPVQHYLGWALEYRDRLESHRANQGAKLLRAVNKAGIAYEVVKCWWGDRGLERRMKNSHHLKRYCPVCRAAEYEAKAAKRRASCQVEEVVQKTLLASCESVA